MTQNNINTSSVLLQSVTTSTSAVITCSTAIPGDNSIPQNTEGTEILTLSITPMFSNSTLEILYTGVTTANGTGSFTTTALFQDSTVNAISANCYENSNSQSLTGILRYYMTSGTISSTTFKIRIGNNTLTVYLNGDASGNRLMGGVSASRLTINEYK